VTTEASKQISMQASGQEHLPHTPLLTILTGALGSGKTSLLDVFLRDGAAASTAVVVNEAGAINIDGAILAESAGGLPMATLSNGCVCCSLMDDLVRTIEALITDRAARVMPPFERIVLECSGLSQPGPIVRALQPLMTAGMRVHIVATYDCTRPPLHGEGFDDAAAQLSAAHTVVLTKHDMASIDQRLAARVVVQDVAPFALLVDVSGAHDRAAQAFQEVSGEWAGAVAEGGDRPGITASQSVSNVSNVSNASPFAGLLAHSRVQVLAATLDAQPDWDDFLVWLEDLSYITGERLLRLKAIVDEPHDPSGLAKRVVQSVGTTFGPHRRIQSDVPVDPTAILIVRDVDINELRAVRAPFKVGWASVPRGAGVRWPAQA
jgi:G3E family GTPase